MGKHNHFKLEIKMKKQQLLQNTRTNPKLLEVTSTKDKSAKSDEQTNEEALRKMLQDKVNLIENISEDPNKIGANSKGKLYAGAHEDKLQDRVTKIFKNGNIENKEKITQMIKIYEEEIITGYE